MAKHVASTALHAHIHFGGKLGRASVNLRHEYTDATHLPGAQDLDVEVPKGSALEKAIDHVGKLLATAAAKVTGQPVTVVEYDGEGEPKSPRTKKAAKRAK